MRPFTFSSAFSLTLIATLAIGCAAQSTDDLPGHQGGGKADGDTESGPLRLVSDEAQQYLSIADAECLHVNQYSSDLLEASIKLICMHRGGTAAPTAMYIAAMSPGEGNGVFALYEVPRLLGDLPEAVSFRASGSKAIYAYTGQAPTFTDDGLIEYQPTTVTATLEFSGPPEAPTITATYVRE